MSYKEIKNVVDNEILGDEEIWDQYKETVFAMGTYQLLSEQNRETNLKILFDNTRFSQYYLKKYREKYDSNATMDDLQDNINRLSMSELEALSLRDNRFDIY